MYDSIKSYITVILKQRKTVKSKAICRNATEFYIPFQNSKPGLQTFSCYNIKKQHEFNVF